jgi:hypothetical protein
VCAAVANIESLKYFPIIQILVFRFVPAPLWVPFFNLLALAFGIYINVTANTNENKYDKKKKKKQTNFNFNRESEPAVR